MANQRELSGCESAVSICEARLPVTPACSLTSSASTQDEMMPRSPTTKSRRGTKNRKSRRATAAPTTVPADSRSRR
jgi:hypothetical protein